MKDTKKVSFPKGRSQKFHVSHYNLFKNLITHFESRLTVRPVIAKVFFNHIEKVCLYLYVTGGTMKRALKGQA